MKKNKYIFIIAIFLITAFSQNVFAEDLSDLAVALYNDNSLEEAYSSLMQIPDNQKTAQDYLLLGNIHDEKGDKQGAIALYQKSINLDKSCYKSYYNMANVYVGLLNYYRAIYYCFKE